MVCLSTVIFRIVLSDLFRPKVIFLECIVQKEAAAVFDFFN